MSTVIINIGLILYDNAAALLASNVKTITIEQDM